VTLLAFFPRLPILSPARRKAEKDGKREKVCSFNVLAMLRLIR
jgi:hypothetical protein